MNKAETPYNPSPLFEFKIDLYKLRDVKKWWLSRQRERRAIRHAKTEWYYTCG